MTPEQAIAEAKRGELRPVYLVMGEERLLVDRATAALREAAQKGGIAGFNEDKFTAGETPIDSVISAVKMVPMMAKRRFVLVRALERWEKKADEEEAAPAKGSKSKGVQASPLDELAACAAAPIESTVLVLTAQKLHGQRRIVTAAKKNGFLVACDPLPTQAIPGWIEKSARERGHTISLDVAESLAAMLGSNLSSVEDALDRLSLYVGEKQPIEEEAVMQLVTRVRQSSLWELMDLVARRKVGPALATLADNFDPRDGGLPLLGSLAWSVRRLVKFESALRGGAEPSEAAQRAGMQPFRGASVAQMLRGMPKGALASWLRLLAEADLALKGSKRQPQAVLEGMILAMCKG